jgi:hypothetical protein
MVTDADRQPETIGDYASGCALLHDVRANTLRKYRLAADLSERSAGAPVRLDKMDEIRFSAWLRDLAADRAPTTVGKLRTTSPAAGCGHGPTPKGRGFWGALRGSDGLFAKTPGECPKDDASASISVAPDALGIAVGHSQTPQNQGHEPFQDGGPRSRAAPSRDGIRRNGLMG